MIADRASLDAVIRAALDGAGLEYDRRAEGSYAVVLPGTHKQQTTCRLVVGDQALRVEAFVVRRPDENHEAVYAWLLRHNARLYGVAWSIDGAGDVYLTGRLPLHAVTAEELDRVLGSVLTYSDGAFDQLLALGFATAIRREYDYRVTRGMPTDNLRAFTALTGDAQG